MAVCVFLFTWFVPPYSPSVCVIWFIVVISFLSFYFKDMFLCQHACSSLLMHVPLYSCTFHFQHNLERLERKKDLELLIAEQQETIDILCKHQTDKDELQFIDSSTTPSSTRSHDTLGSIDEISDNIVSSSIVNTSSVSGAMIHFYF